VSPQAFIVWTEEGSRFVARFDPQIEDAGITYGKLRVIGHCKTVGRKLEIVGMGCAPAVGGKLIVSDKPIRTYTFQGEEVPVYEHEVIASVEDVTDWVDGASPD
jgi:hypothetical protein